jgi:hypothetical protein
LNEEIETESGLILSIEPERQNLGVEIANSIEPESQNLAAEITNSTEQETQSVGLELINSTSIGESSNTRSIESLPSSDDPEDEDVVIHMAIAASIESALSEGAPGFQLADHLQGTIIFNIIKSFELKASTFKTLITILVILVLVYREY